MQVRSIFVVLSGAALCACGAAQPSTAPAPPAEAAIVSAANAPAFVGLWAASPALCADPAWRFAAREVSTQGEVHCAFTDVTENAGHFRIAAMCTAEAPPAPYALELDLGAGVMRVSGGPWAAPIDLVYCAPAPSE